jgi:hypothetical protein
VSGSAEVSLLSHLALALRVSLGLVFALAVLPKLRRPLAFARGVVEYRLLPTGLAYAFGLILIPAEALLAAALLAGRAPGLALGGAALVFGVFLAAVGLNLERGRRISCGCFGKSSEEISPRAAVRLALLLAVSLLLVILEVSGRLPLPGPAAPAPGLPVFFDAAFTLFLAAFFLLAGSWILRAPELRPLLRSLRPARRPTVQAPSE